MQGSKFVSHSNYHTDGVILVLSGSLLHQIQLVKNWDDLVVSGSKWEKETKHLGVRRGISHPMANSQAHNAVKDKQTNRQTVRNQKCCQISGRKDIRLKCVFTNVVLSLWKTKSKKNQTDNIGDLFSFARRTVLQSQVWPETVVCKDICRDNWSKLEQLEHALLRFEPIFARKNCHYYFANLQCLLSSCDFCISNTVRLQL